MKVAVIAVALALSPVTAAATPKPDPSGCEKTYTRPHFHTAARSTYATPFPPRAKVRTLDRIVRCQRRLVSLPIVRKHRTLYRHAWAVRFWAEHEWATVPAWLKVKLARIAGCESHGDPGAISDSGQYRGRYQFDDSTWASVGGRGDPAAAPAIEQDVRAARLYLSAGPGRWPHCGFVSTAPRRTVVSA